MSLNQNSTRRDFLKTASASFGVPFIITSAALGNSERPPASDRIVMGGIGIGNMGRGDQGAFVGRKDVQYVALSDVRDEVREKSKAGIDKHYNNSDCQTYNDFRELLARTDIDAVHVATPDHWHSIMVIEACRNGKDVYCQKPETLTLREGPLMISAARRYGRVVSGGSQRVLGDYRKYVDPAWAGEFGKIKSINVNVGPLPQLCNLPTEEMSEKIDWDLSARSRALGALQFEAMQRQLFDQRCELAFVQRLFGRRHDRLGAHHFGGATFICDVRELQPEEVSYFGDSEGKYLAYRYPNGLVIYHNRPKTENMFIEGTPGEKLAPKAVPTYKGHGDIYGDFIECVKTREKPFRDIESAVNTAVLAHLGNIAYQLKRSLKWDAAKQEFVGDAEANRFVDRARREPWQL